MPAVETAAAASSPPVVAAAARLDLLESGAIAAGSHGELMFARVDTLSESSLHLLLTMAEAGEAWCSEEEQEGMLP